MNKEQALAMIVGQIKQMPTDKNQLVNIDTHSLHLLADAILSKESMLNAKSHKRQEAIEAMFEYVSKDLESSGNERLSGALKNMIEESREGLK